MPVYPAREAAIPGVDAELIAGKMDLQDVTILDASRIIDFVRENKPRVLITLGAGNIDRLVAPITECLKEMQL